MVTTLAQIIGAAETRKRFTAPRIAMLVIEALWVAFLWIIFIGKWVDAGFVGFFKYLTNWTWTLNLVFYTLDITLGFALPKTYFVYGSAVFVWLVYGVNWIVFWLVFYLLENNPSQVTDMVEETNYLLGIILIFERFFHVLPNLFTNGWVIFRHREIRDAYEWILLKSRLHNRRVKKTVFYVIIWLCIGLVGPLLFISLWRLFFDPVAVYELTNVNAALLVTLCVIIALSMSGIGLLLVGTNFAGNHEAVKLHEASNYTYLREFLDFFINVSWCITLLSVCVIWLVKFGGASFISHFEMWFFSVSLVYYTLLLIDVQARYYRMLVWTLTWSIVTLAWLCFWMAFLAYFREADHIIDVNGNLVLDGIEFVIDRVLKVVPLIVVFFTIALKRELLLARWRDFISTTRLFYLLAVGGSLAIPFVISLTYRSMFDPCIVYANTTADYAWVLVAIVVSVVFGVGTQYLILHETLHTFERNLKEAHHVDIVQT